MEKGEQAFMNVIEDGGRAGTLLHPLRMRILERLRDADSASGLAKRLGMSRQKINYHLRELEKQGLVQLVEERRKGNCVERVVRATARSYLVSPEILGSLAANPEDVGDRFSTSYLVATAARTIREVALMKSRANEANKKLPTFTLQADVRFRSAADLNAFTELLSNEVARLVATFHDEAAPGGRAFRFFIGAYPAFKDRRSRATRKERS